MHSPPRRSRGAAAALAGAQLSGARRGGPSRRRAQAGSSAGVQDQSRSAPSPRPCPQSAEPDAERGWRTACRRALCTLHLHARRDAVSAGVTSDKRGMRFTWAAGTMRRQSQTCNQFCSPADHAAAARWGRAGARAEAARRAGPALVPRGAGAPCGAPRSCSRAARGRPVLAACCWRGAWACVEFGRNENGCLMHAKAWCEWDLVACTWCE